MRLQKIPLQILGEFVDWSGADIEVKFRKVPVKKVYAQKVPAQIPIGEVPACSGTEVPVQIS